MYTGFESMIGLAILVGISSLAGIDAVADFRSLSDDEPLLHGHVRHAAHDQRAAVRARGSSASGLSS